jgi:hypothetical protein
MFARLLANLAVKKDQVLSKSSGLDAFQRYSTFLKPKPFVPKGTEARMLHNFKKHPERLMADTDFPSGYTNRSSYTPQGRGTSHFRNSQDSWNYSSNVQNARNNFLDRQSSMKVGPMPDNIPPVIEMPPTSPRVNAFDMDRLRPNQGTKTNIMYEQFEDFVDSGKGGTRPMVKRL